MKFKVYDKKGEFLGIINGKDPKDALKEAHAFDMKEATRVVAIQENQNKVTRLTKKIYFN